MRVVARTDCAGSVRSSQVCLMQRMSDLGQTGGMLGNYLRRITIASPGQLTSDQRTKGRWPVFP